MAKNQKKFLDVSGVTHLAKMLDNYPDNEILGTVIDSIQGELEKKAEKSEIPDVPVQDVQVNGTSVLQNGIANMPTGIPNPATKAAGDFLVYNGTEWVAQTLATWQGGNY